MKSDHQKSTKTAGATLTAIVLLAVAAYPLQAQTPEVQTQTAVVQKQTTDVQKQTPDVQELKDRVKQLEQTVDELKAQINSIEDSQKQAAMVAEAAPSPAVVRETSANGVHGTVAKGNPETAANGTPNTAAKPQDTTPKGESTFEISGFAMLDAGYDFKTNDPTYFDVVRPTRLPSFGGEFAPNGKTYWGVRQSRLGVRSSTPTKYGELKTIFEFELFGVGANAGETTFRLRHAYGELGQFGAGQYWSPFMDIDIFPNQLEYWGPNAMVFFRNVQLRWMPLKGRNAVTIALERPGATADQGRFQDRIELQGIEPKFDLPDLSGNVRFTRDWGYFQAAGMLRRIKWRDTNQDEFDLSGQATGIGLNLTSNLKFSENDTGKFGIVYGQGIENYMNDAPTDVGIARDDSGDPRRPIKGVALPMLGVTGFLDHNWNDRFSSAIGYSFLNIQNSAGQLPNAFNHGHYALTNLLWHPVENVTIGGEFIYGRRTNFQDGFASEDFRIQFGFKYNFSKLWKIDQ